MNIYHEFTTSQHGINNKLVTLVDRHLKTEFLRPFPQAQIEAAEKIKHFVRKVNKPVIIDSGCGTGLSTTKLAEIFPDHAIVGIDRSLARISRAVHTSSSNYLIIRGDLVDIWRLLAKESLPITHHFMFYPNPYPKASQVKRRFYAHPVFSSMIGLSTYFELRTNWSIFAQECVEALRVLHYQPHLKIKTTPDYISLFEKKYMESSCPIYIVSSSRNDH